MCHQRPRIAVVLPRRTCYNPLMKKTPTSKAKPKAKSAAAVKDLKPKKSAKGGYQTVTMSDVLVSSVKRR